MIQQYKPISSRHLPPIYRRSDQRLRVFENRVLRRIFGPKRDEISDGRLEKTA
jgi:hypothetical protein